MQINLRQETTADHGQVARVIQEAFQEEPHSDQTEDLLVERLRRSSAFVPELSIVAECDGKIVGYILLTRIKIRDKDKIFESLALAPVAVKPGFQHQGIGGQLIEAAHKSASKLGFKSVVLVGHEEYYPRFGYKLCSQYGIELPFDAPEENCMVIELVKDGLKGVSGLVEYPEAFFE